MALFLIMSVNHTHADPIYVSVSWSQVRNYIRNRMTNQTAGATP
jgi:hypothetical protein